MVKVPIFTAETEELKKVNGANPNIAPLSGL